MPGVLVPGSPAWVLAEHGNLIFPEWLASGWRGSGRRGRKAWPARVLMTLVLLRWSEEGMSRLGSCDRAEVDPRWRAAMGLRMGGPTPCERTVTTSRMEMPVSTCVYVYTFSSWPTQQFELPS